MFNVRGKGKDSRLVSFLWSSLSSRNFISKFLKVIIMKKIRLFLWMFLFFEREKNMGICNFLLLLFLCYLVLFCLVVFTWCRFKIVSILSGTCHIHQHQHVQYHHIQQPMQQQPQHLLSFIIFVVVVVGCKCSVPVVQFEKCVTNYFLKIKKKICTFFSQSENRKVCPKNKIKNNKTINLNLEKIVLKIK